MLTFAQISWGPRSFRYQAVSSQYQPEMLVRPTLLTYVSLLRARGYPMTVLYCAPASRSKDQRSESQAD